jgi:ankyrin repeat protein
VQLLLDFEAPIDAANADGFTALITACKMGHTEVVRLLLQRGADVNAVTKSNYTVGGGGP